MSNPHHERAESRLRNGTINEVTRAGVEAQLDIAHELRTANLIALYARLSDGSVCLLDELVNEATVARQIKERLGL